MLEGSSQAGVLQTLDRDSLFAKVRELQPRIAVFDCDGTLWSGDAGAAFMRWSFDQGLVAGEKATALKTRYEGYLRGEVSELAICGEMVQVYAGLAESRLREAASVFFCEKLEQNIFPEMLALVTDLQQSGVDIWAVSSTCEWVIAEGVTRFNISADRVLAASVDVVDGIVSADLLDVPTDEGKVVSLRRAGITSPDVVFGNSVHDAAMLAIARGAFPINPSPDLLLRSATEGWPIFFPAAVAPYT